MSVTLPQATLPDPARSLASDNQSLRRVLHGLPGVDQVGAEARAAALATRSIKTTAKAWAIDTAISMVDLTTLEGSDTPGKVRSLCGKARRPDPSDPSAPAVAAVCVYPDLVDTAGVRTTYGSRIHAAHVPKSDAVIIARMRAAGAIEFALAFALIWSPLLARVGAIILTAMFISAVFEFGKVDMIGHSAIIAVLIVIAADSKKRTRLTLRPFLMPLGYGGAFAATLLIYYAAHSLLYGTSLT